MLKNLLRSGTSHLLGTKNEWTGILKLSIYTWMQRNGPVTTHMWTYKCFLSQLEFRSAWHQWRVIVCTGISSCTCSPRCWFIMVIMRALPFLQLVTSQLTSQAKFCGVKLSRMAADPQKLQKFNPAKIEAYTVYSGYRLCPWAITYTYSTVGRSIAGRYIRNLIVVPFTKKILSQLVTLP